MKHRERILIFLVIITTTYTQGFKDNQLWHAEKFQKKINDKTSLALEQDFRLGNNASELRYVHADFGIKHQLTKVFFVSLNFREVFEQKGDKLTREHRPHGQIAWKGKIGLYSISSRARLEYRMKQDKDPVFRNRDMISIKFDKGFTPLKLIPYMADEIFYDLEESELNRNRFYIGAEIGSIKMIKPVMYFLIQSGYTDEEWSHIGILGFKFIF
jgi:hypothetical protein